MSNGAPARFADSLLAAALQAPAALRLHTFAHSPFTTDLSEGTLITVVQPDGTRDEYRLSAPEPTADGFGISFRAERTEGQ